MGLKSSAQSDVAVTEPVELSVECARADGPHHHRTQVPHSSCSYMWRSLIPMLEDDDSERREKVSSDLKTTAQAACEKVCAFDSR